MDTFYFKNPGHLIDAELSLRLKETRKRNEDAKTVATYCFDICVDNQIAGGIRLRAQNDFDVVSFAGNIGYDIQSEFRGRHLAERACRLLLPFAKANDLDSLWITCDPENGASRRTCERLGAQLIDIVELPEDSDMYQDGERLKCRYRLPLSAEHDPA